MPLTSEQIAKRAGKITASRVSCLMTGDKEKIHQLYLEMVGLDVPVDLSDVWPVRLGEATESLNREWYERKTGRQLLRVGYVMEHPQNIWAAATLDGWDQVLKCPVECKHCGGREPIEVVIDRYQPQMQWQMYVTGAKQCALSVIFGANEPIVEYVDRADDYIEEMVKRAAAFKQCVDTQTPPVVLDPVPPPVSAHKIVDMTGNNAWAAGADEWLGTRQEAERNKNATITLKALVPDDARKAFGYGVYVVRDRAGRLSLREGAHE